MRKKLVSAQKYLKLGAQRIPCTFGLIHVLHIANNTITARYSERFNQITEEISIQDYGDNKSSILKISKTDLIACYHIFKKHGWKVIHLIFTKQFFRDFG